jgi:hypothetical protein
MCRADECSMDDRLAQGYVLTLHLAADQITGDVADHVIRDLSHLSAVRGPTKPGNLLVHCTVSAPSEGDAVRYAAQRTITALLGAGVETPRVLSIEACHVDHVAV